MSNVVAIAVADIHLCHNRPSARADDWYEVMLHYLGELRAIAAEHGNPPILASGDIFDFKKCPRII